MSATRMRYVKVSVWVVSTSGSCCGAPRNHSGLRLFKRQKTHLYELLWRSRCPDECLHRNPPVHQQKGQSKFRQNTCVCGKSIHETDSRIRRWWRNRTEDILPVHLFPGGGAYIDARRGGMVSIEASRRSSASFELRLRHR